jgi:hypothetical protein
MFRKLFYRMFKINEKVAFQRIVESNFAALRALHYGLTPLSVSCGNKKFWCSTQNSIRREIIVVGYLDKENMEIALSLTQINETGMDTESVKSLLRLHFEGSLLAFKGQYKIIIED